MTPRDWDESDEARRLLAELDAAERWSDRYSGLGWSNVCEALAERCGEIESELDELRDATLRAFADTASDDRDSDAWFEAWDEADCEAVTVKQAAEAARRMRLGDSLMLEAA